MHEQVNKYFTTKNIIFSIMMVLFLIFIAKIADITIMFFAAFVVSAALLPAIKKLEKYMPRALAVALVLFLVLIAVMGIVVPLVVLTLKQGAIFIKDLPSHILKFQDFIANFSILGFHPGQYLDFSDLSDISNTVVPKIVSQSLSITKVVTTFFTTVLAVTIMVFYICFDTKKLFNTFCTLFPKKMQEHASEILNTIVTRVGGYLMAQILMMLFVGVLTSVGLLIIHQDHAFMLGFIACILDIVPAVGPVLAFVIAVLVALPGGSLMVLGVCVIFGIVQLLENQVLRPLIFSKFMDMHPLTIILSLFVGAKFLGIWGVILAPALACVVCVLIDELYVKQINKETDIKVISDTEGEVQN